MKKAFDQNVSRAKPRLRLGPTFAETIQTEDGGQVAPVAELMPSPEQGDEQVSDPQATGELNIAAELTDQVRARAERAKAPKLAATEAVQRAIEDVQAVVKRPPV